MDQAHRARIEYEAIVVAYAMSRLDGAYLRSRRLGAWTRAFDEASGALAVPASSIKNLRDEFDPVHGNSRRGWHKRPLRPNRQRVMAEFCEVSDDALMEFVDRVIRRDTDSIAEALDSLASGPTVAFNTAERLRTGRLAEEYFLAHSPEIVGAPPEDVLDHRLSARGFDFGLRSRPEIAVEVKGLRRMSGEILFTDREWREARLRGTSYWVVVVGNLEGTAVARLFGDPSTSMRAICRYQKSITANWSAKVDL